MSQENVDNIRRGYDALNQAYRSGEVDEFRSVAEEVWDPSILFHLPVGPMATGGTWRGYDAMLRFIAYQLKTYREPWVEPEEFIEAGEGQVIVPVRFGGRARDTGIQLEFTAVHVITMRHGKAVRIAAFETKEQALEAAGLRE